MGRDCKARTLKLEKNTSEADDGQGGSRRTEEPMQQGND